MYVKVLAGLGAAGILAVGGFLYFRAEQPAPSQQLAAVVTAATSTVATATTIKKNLYLTPAGSAQTEDIPESVAVSTGDLLATSQDGRGLVTMPNGSTAVLDYDSSMTIKNLDASGKRMSLRLLAGSVWARVEKVFDKGEYLEIQTQNAVAAVRGTSFGLSYRKDGSVALLVSEGTVSLTPLDPVTGLAQEEKTRVIPAGERGVISPDGSISQAAISAPDKSSEWFLYNNSGDSKAPDNAAPAPASQSIPAPKTPSEPVPVPAPTTLKTEPIKPKPIARPASSEDTGNLCASFSEAGAGLASDSLKLSGISPSSVSQSQSSTVTLKGEGFNCVMTIVVGGKVLTGESDFTVLDNSTITFPSDILPIGTFRVLVSDSLGATAASLETLSVTR